MVTHNCWTALWVLACVALATSGAPYPPSGMIFGPTTWTRAISPVSITVDLTVLPNAHLVIEAGVSVVFEGCYTISIVGTGTVTIDGTLEASVDFDGGHHSCSKAAIDVGYRTIQERALSVSHARFHGFFTGIQIETWTSASVLVADSIFEHNVRGVAGESPLDGSYRFENCTFRNNTRGIVCPSAEVVGCLVQRNRELGINSEDGTVEASHVLDNGGRGVSVDRGTVRGCVVSGNDVGVYGTGLVAHSYVTDNRVGVEASATSQDDLALERSNICGNSEYNFMTTSVSGTLTSDTVWWGTADLSAAITMVSDARTVSGVGLLPLDLAGGPIDDVPVDGRCTAPQAPGATANSSAAYPTSGNIIEDTTWTFAMSPVSITIDLTVHSGVSLVIEAGVSVVFRGCYTISIIGAGTVIVDGTLAAPVDFDGGRNRSCTSPAIRAGRDNSQRLELAVSHARFHGFHKGIVIPSWTWSAVVVRDSVFEDNVDGILGEAPLSGSQRFENCTFRNNTRGIVCPTIEVVGCVFRHNLELGAHTYSGTVQSSWALDNGGKGVSVDRGTVRGCVVSGNDVGVYGSGLVEHSYVTDNRMGVEASMNSAEEALAIERSNICGNSEYNFMATSALGTLTSDTVWWGTADLSAAITMVSDARAVSGVGLLPLDLAGGPIDDVLVDGRCTAPQAPNVTNISTPYPASGNIIEDTTWTSAMSPVVVTGDLTVYPEVTLVIEAGVSVVFRGCYTISIIGTGTVIVDGTLAAPVDFNGGRNRSCTSPAIDVGWYTVQRLALSVSHARFHGFDTGIQIETWTWASVLVADSLFEDNLDGVVGGSPLSGSYRFENCTFRNNTRGIVCPSAEVVGCLVQHNRELGINSEDGTVEASHVLDNGGRGVSVDRGTVRGCVVSGNDVGVYGTGLVAHSYVTDNRVGVEASATSQDDLALERSNICGNSEYSFMTTSVSGTLTSDTVWWGTADLSAAITMVSDARTVSGVGLLPLDLAGGPIDDVPVDGRCTAPLIPPSPSSSPSPPPSPSSALPSPSPSSSPPPSPSPLPSASPSAPPSVSASPASPSPSRSPSPYPFTSSPSPSPPSQSASPAVSPPQSPSSSVSASPPPSPPSPSQSASPAVSPPQSPSASLSASPPPSPSGSPSLPPPSPSPAPPALAPSLSPSTSASPSPSPASTPNPSPTPAPSPPLSPEPDVILCHKPGTPAQQTLVVPASALQAHRSHGDTDGACSAGERHVLAHYAGTNTRLAKFLLHIAPGATPDPLTRADRQQLTSAIQGTEVVTHANYTQVFVDVKAAAATDIPPPPGGTAAAITDWGPTVQRAVVSSFPSTADDSGFTRLGLAPPPGDARAASFLRVHRFDVAGNEVTDAAMRFTVCVPGAPALTVFSYRSGAATGVDVAADGGSVAGPDGRGCFAVAVRHTSVFVQVPAAAPSPSPSPLPRPAAASPSVGIIIGSAVGVALGLACGFVILRRFRHRHRRVSVVDAPADPAKAKDLDVTTSTVRVRDMEPSPTSTVRGSALAAVVHDLGASTATNVWGRDPEAGLPTPRVRDLSASTSTSARDLGASVSAPHVWDLGASAGRGRDLEWGLSAPHVRDLGASTRTVDMRRSPSPGRPMRSPGGPMRSPGGRMRSPGGRMRSPGGRMRSPGGPIRGSPSPGGPMRSPGGQATPLTGLYEHWSGVRGSFAKPEIHVVEVGDVDGPLGQTVSVVPQ